MSGPVEELTPPIPGTGRPGEAPSRCVERLTRASGTSFYYAFLILPRPRREAIFAVYAFCRAVDSAVDEAQSPEHAQKGIEYWRRELDAAFEGAATEPLAIRVGEVARQFDLPKSLFEEVVEGVASDLESRRFATWAELAGYCDLVAGAVGRLCVRVFGHREPWADEYARELGLALQITNILRDLGPDSREGRFYLPKDHLDRFGVTEDDVLSDSPRRLPLLQFEAKTARGHFDQAARLGARGGHELGSARIMAAIYRRLLERVEGAGFPLGEPVIRVPRTEKALLALSALVRGPWRSRG